MDLFPNPKGILFYTFKTANHVHIKYILLTYFCSSSLNTAAFNGQEKVTKYNMQRTQMTKNWIVAQNPQSGFVVVSLEI